uniref:Uncharacterized protein n=1 Tax=Anguilla anguilla TaxID=7936 RepID=A0A0E9VUI3_ANGAN
MVLGRSGTASLECFQKTFQCFIICLFCVSLLFICYYS